MLKTKAQMGPSTEVAGQYFGIITTEAQRT